MNAIVIKKKIFLKMLLFLMIVLWSGSPYQTAFPIIDRLQIPTALALSAYVLVQKKGRIKISLYGLSSIVFVYMIVLTMLTHMDTIYSYVKFICFVMVAYYVTMMFDLRDIVDIYLKTMTIIAGISLIGHYLVNNTSALNSLPEITNINDIEYGIGFLFNYIKIASNRNCGIFWEPGIYASYLSMAVMFELCFKHEERSKLRLLIFTVTLLTTNSSAGFVLLLLCIILFVTPNIKKRNSVFANIFSYTLLVLLLLIFINIETIIMGIPGLASNDFVIKLLPDNMLNSSRILGPLHNLRIFASNPIFGAGYYYVSTHMQFFADISTSTYLLSVFGILGLFYSLCWGIGIFSQKHLNLYTRIVLFAMIMTIVNKETHIMILFTWILMFFLIKEKNYAEVDITQR